MAKPEIASLTPAKKNRTNGRSGDIEMFSSDMSYFRKKPDSRSGYKNRPQSRSSDTKNRTEGRSGDKPDTRSGGRHRPENRSGDSNRPTSRSDDNRNRPESRSGDSKHRPDSRNGDSRNGDGKRQSRSGFSESRPESRSGDVKNRPENRSGDSNRPTSSSGDNKNRPESRSGDSKHRPDSRNGDSKNRPNSRNGDSKNRPDSKNGFSKNRPDSKNSGMTRPESRCVTPTENKKMVLLEQSKQRSKEINTRKEEKFRNALEIRKQKAKDLAENKKRRSASAAGGGQAWSRYGAFSPLLTIGGGDWAPASKAWNSGIVTPGITGLIAQYAAGELGKDEDGVYPKPPPNYRWPGVSSNKAHHKEVKSEGIFSRVAKRLHGPVGKQVCGTCQRKRAACMEKMAIPKSRIEQNVGPDHGPLCVTCGSISV